MVVAEIACTCGHKFTVADDGNGSPHPCPRCQVQNVLARRQPESRTRSGVLQSAGDTAVRSTSVISPVAAAHQTVLQGLPAGTMVGPYRIVRRVGRGGMGSVYEAIDDRSSQRVALKVLSPELSAQPDFVARFHRESRALATFSDDRIARVYFSGAAEGVPFFAMEFVDGKNLEELLAERGPLGCQQAIEWMREIAVGLNSAAEHGLIHRDVKPTNVLVDSRGRIKIVDFGLAKALNSDTRLTVTGAVVGTPFYLSPEQGLSKSVDQRSDIYSLGATFYHLLTGRPPFEAENSVSIILKHVNDPFTPIRDCNSKVTESLARIVTRCLAKEPRHRYQDYDELINDLDAARDGEPVAAPSESATIRRAPTFVVVDDLDDGSLVLRRASRARRMMALALDLALILGIAALMRGGEFNDLRIGGLVLPFALAYFAFGDAGGGKTLGKQFFRLRVGKADGGAPGIFRGLVRGLVLSPLAIAPIFLLSRGSLALDDLLTLLSDLEVIGRAEVGEIAAMYPTIRLGVAIAAGVDLAISLFNSRGATLHDALSGTYVFREEMIKRRKKPPKERPISPIVPLVSSVIPGLGQLVNGEMGKALGFFIAMAATAAFWVWIVVWGLAAYEAWWTATQRVQRWQKLNPQL